jgi:hypothetical protein
MAIFTVRHDESVNYSIRLVIEFKPIALEEGENILPLLRQANGKYGYTELRDNEGMYDAVLLTIVDKKYQMKSKLQEIRNEVGKNINDTYAQMKG